MIRLLPDSVSSHLRSGVAITSIAQCVEELVLNSLDAGASCVAVRVDISCFKVQVVDNGCGIPVSQLDVIATRHYTSKCKELMDLDNLEYFGFRGEALASMCEISAILDISTRIKESTKTYCKLFHNGRAHKTAESKLQRPAAGTTVTVHDLFNKLPVRKTTTNQVLELERIKQRLEAIALMNPQTSISLRNDETGNKILQTTKPGSTIKVFKQLFGATKAGNLLEVCCVKDRFRVVGWISSEGHFNKNLQFVYINTRLVLKTRIHKLLNKALRKLYSSRKKAAVDVPNAARGSPSNSASPTKQTDRHGIFVMNIECPFNEYDITFDPTKTLVEFKDWDMVLSAVDGVVTEVQKQFSVCVSPVGVKTDDIPEGDVERRTDKDMTTDICTSTGMSSPSEICTSHTGNSLHSKFARRDGAENLERPSASPHLDLGVKRSEDDCDNFPKMTKNYVDVDSCVSLVSSDTASSCSGVCVADRCAATDEEDPLCPLGTSGRVTNQLTSPDLGTGANDSGIDPGVITDTKHVVEIDNQGQTSDDIPNSPGTVQSVTEKPKMSYLSELRRKQPEQRMRKTKTVSCKLKELRQSLFKGTVSSPGEPKRDENKTFKSCAITSSLQRLRETVEKLQGKTSLQEFNKGTTKPEKAAVSEETCDSNTLGSALTTLKRAGESTPTTSSKLARLAGICVGQTERCDEGNSLGGNPITPRHCDMFTSPIKATKADDKYSAVSTSGNEINILIREDIRDTRLSETFCKSSKPGSTFIQNCGNDSSQDSRAFMSATSLKNLSMDEVCQQKQTQRHLMTSESLLTNLTENIEMRSSAKMGYGNQNQKVSAAERFDIIDVDELKDHVSTTDKSMLDPQKWDDACDRNVVAAHERAASDPNATKNSDVRDKTLELGVGQKLGFFSQDGQIRLSQGSQNPADAKDVFKAYQLGPAPCDADPSNDSTASHTHYIVLSPSPVGDDQTESEHKVQTIGMSQGFDFRTMQPIPNTSRDVLSDLHASTPETLNSDDMTMSPPDLASNIKPAGCDTDKSSSSGKDLVDLLITPEMPSLLKDPCPNQPGFFDYSPGNQSVSEWKTTSENPASDAKLKLNSSTSEVSGLSPCSPLSVSPEVGSIADMSPSDLSPSDLSGAYIQTAVPGHVAKVTTHRVRVLKNRHPAGDSPSLDIDQRVSSSSQDEIGTTPPDNCCTEIKTDEVISSNPLNDDRDALLESGGADCVEEMEIKTTSDISNLSADDMHTLQEESKMEIHKPEETKEHSGQSESRSDLFLIRSHPQSGKKIFIHPLTGHTLDEAAWEVWNKQISCESEKPGVEYNSKKKRLLSHDLAYLLRKPATSRAGCEAGTTKTAVTAGESGDDAGLDHLWTDHVIGQCKEDSVKWRYPASTSELTESDMPTEMESMIDLFEDWDNPVFSLPEQEITTVELPGRQTKPVKVQRVVQPCRFTRNMLTQAQVLGQVDDKFIACLMRTEKEKNLSSEGSLLVLVDQHAAHERVRLEQLTEDSFVANENGGDRELKRSEVIPPVKLKLTEDIVRVMSAYQGKFEKMGVAFSTSATRDTVLLKSAPSCFVEREANEIKRGRSSVVMDMMEAFISEQVEVLQKTHGAMSGVPAAVHKLLCSQACHGAIKFGDSLNLEECQDIVESLSLCDLPFQCAHGRPAVMPVLDLDNFRSKFPQKTLGKPKLWKLQHNAEESLAKETSSEKDPTCPSGVGVT